MFVVVHLLKLFWETAISWFPKEPALLHVLRIRDSVGIVKDVDFADVQEDTHFKWNAGFGQEDSYDWPKQVENWKTTKWQKKHSS